MKRIRKLVTLLALAGTLSVLAFAPASAPPVQAAVSGTIIYNLYATDGYATVADGTQVYNYGFVGGRQGQPLKYLDKNGVLKTLPGNGDAPAPTGGPVTAAEQALQGNAQLPAPLIYAAVGDVVEIRLKNLGVTVPTAPNDPHSIHLHGLDVDAANDGVPETSVGAVPANQCADGETHNDCSANGGSAEGAGNVIVYMFSPKFPGTYMYHCHQEADIHVQMGMYGALVVYNRGDEAASTGPGTGKGGNLFGWKYDKDVVLLLSEIDVRQHCAEEGTYTSGGLCPNVATLPGQVPDWNPVDYDPQYWIINGLSFPNTIHVNTVGFNWDDWIAAHPGYDPFIKGSISKAHPNTRITKGDKVLIRMINLGFETQPMHMHGYHGKVIGSDQRGWYWANTFGITPFGLGLEKNTVTIGSGETYEWLVDFGQQSMAAGVYAPNTQTRYDPTNNNLPVVNTQTGKPVMPVPNEPGVSYIGGPQVTGFMHGPDVGQYFPFHNHDDYKATNNGVYPGGMFTMIETLP